MKKHQHSFIFYFDCVWRPEGKLIINDDGLVVEDQRAAIQYQSGLHYKMESKIRNDQRWIVCVYVASCSLFKCNWILEWIIPNQCKICGITSSKVEQIVFLVSLTEMSCWLRPSSPRIHNPQIFFYEVKPNNGRGSRDWCHHSTSNSSSRILIWTFLTYLICYV